MKIFKIYRDFNNERYSVRLIYRDNDKVGYFSIFDIINQMYLTSRWIEIEYNEILNREYIELPYYEFSRIFAD